MAQVTILIVAIVEEVENKIMVAFVIIKLAVDHFFVGILNITVVKNSSMV